MTIDIEMTEKFSESLKPESASESDKITIVDAEVPLEVAGQRLDQVAPQLFPDFSRSRLQSWIKLGNLQVDGKSARGKDKLNGGETITLEAVLEQQNHWQPEPIPFAIVYEDEALIVINKQAGLVVHPAAGNRSGTLLNGLLHHCPELGQIPRAGIVHRLDKETSGLMVVAKTLESHLALVKQLRDKVVSRIYQAVVCGLVTAGGKIDEPLGRHPVHRTKRAVSHGADAREAVSHYRVLQKFRSHTLVQVTLETGRTHQIRVHMTHLGFPLVGDPVYGGRPRIPKGSSPELISYLEKFKRQALHAWQLGLTHPLTGEAMTWQADIPEDMQALLELLETDNV